GYSLLLALTLPITFACAMFADDVVAVLLGPKWMAAAPIFRLLAPTVLVFAIANPLAWLLSSIGLVGRLLKMALVIAPIMVVGYLVGLPYGPKGVALAYSVVMTAWLIPLVIWALHGTAIAPRDILLAGSRPFASSIAAAGLAYAVRAFYAHWLPLVPRLVLESGVLLVAFFGILLFVAGQKSLYLNLLRGLAKPSATKEAGLVSA
ncbi:MAG: lipopolysaccharide biosynthesis protein, partial [Bryobacteraceae bacterium]